MNKNVKNTHPQPSAAVAGGRGGAKEWSVIFAARWERSEMILPRRGGEVIGQWKLDR